MCEHANWEEAYAISDVSKSSNFMRQQQVSNSNKDSTILESKKNQIFVISVIIQDKTASHVHEILGQKMQVDGFFLDSQTFHNINSKHDPRTFTRLGFSLINKETESWGT